MDEQALQQFIAALQSGDPAALEAFAQTGLFPEQMALGGQDYATGAGLMDAPSAAGRNVGGTYVAANPLEHAGVAMTRAMGMKQMQDARAGQKSNMDALTAAKVKFLQAMSQPQAQPQQPQGPPEWQGAPFLYPGQ